LQTGSIEFTGRDAKAARISVFVTTGDGFIQIDMVIDLLAHMQAIQRLL
jgi:hypothetical protein